VSRSTCSNRSGWSSIRPTRQFLPHAFSHQRVDLAIGHHALHQRHRLGRDAEVVEARRKTCHAQQPHRVFDKGVGHMPQHTLLQVALAAVGVDQRAVFVARHRVDGEVAARQVLFQRHVGAGVEGEAVVAAAALAFGARQRHFLARVRVQEDRKSRPTGW
jgi:hypothetical protein